MDIRFINAHKAKHTEISSLEKEKSFISEKNDLSDSYIVIESDSAYPMDDSLSDAGEIAVNNPTYSMDDSLSDAGEIALNTNNYEKNTLFRKNGNKLLVYSPEQRHKRNVKKIVIASIVLATISISMAFAPIIEQSFERIVSEIEVRRRPEQVELSNGIPTLSYIPNTIKNSTEEANKYISLSEASLNSIDTLSANLNKTLKKYSELSKNTTPSFMVVNYDYSQKPISFKLFCDLENNESVCFEYLINDPVTFEDIFESNSMEIPNIINGINTLLISRNLADVPLISQKIKINNTDCYPSAVQESINVLGYNNETLDYDIEEIYTFDYNYTDGSYIYKGNINISKNNANYLEGFDQNNLSSLYALYLKDNSKFVTELALKEDINNTSRILISAKIKAQEKSQGSNLEK